MGCLCLRHTLMTLCGSILTVPLVTVLFPFILAFWCVSVIARVLTYIRFSGKAVKARGTDVIHGKERELTLPIINIGIRITGQLDLNEIKMKMTKVILNTYDKTGERRYRKLMDVYERSFGYYFYRDSGEFNIDNHIRAIDYNELFGENNKAAGENMSWDALIKIMLNKYGHTKFHKSIPQWEMIFVEESEKRYTGLFRIHHGMGDGIYLTRMFCEDFLDRPVILYSSHKVPPKSVRWMTSIWSFFLLPFGILKILLNFDSNPLHGPKLMGKKKYFVTKPMPLQPLKDAKKICGVTLNAVLFTIISYALENYFKRKSIPIEYITALTPIPLQNPLKPIKLKNKFAVAVLHIPTNMAEEEPFRPQLCTDKQKKQLLKDTSFRSQLKRLRVVQRVLSDSKRDPSILAGNTLINTLCTVLPTFLAEKLLSVKGCTISVSNVPGPEEELCVWSGTQDELMFWIPDRNPIGIGVSFMSYNGNIRIGLLLDQGLSNEAQGELMIKDFEDEIENILQTAEIELRRKENGNSTKDGETAIKVFEDGVENSLQNVKFQQRDKERGERVAADVNIV